MKVLLGCSPVTRIFGVIGSRPIYYPRTGTFVEFKHAGVIVPFCSGSCFAEIRSSLFLKHVCRRDLDRVEQVGSIQIRFATLSVKVGMVIT
jgi:hypothetical protein